MKSYFAVLTLTLSIALPASASASYSAAKAILNTLERSECDEPISHDRVLSVATSTARQTVIGKKLVDYVLRKGTRIETLTRMEYSGDTGDLVGEYQHGTDLIVIGKDFLEDLVNQKQAEGLSTANAEEEVGRLIAPILVNELTHAYVTHLYAETWGITMPAMTEEELLSDAFTAAFLHQITEQEPTYIQEANSLSYEMRSPHFIEILRNPNLNLGHFYTSYLKATAQLESVSELKIALIERVKGVMKEKHEEMIVAGLSAPALSSEAQELGDVVIPPRSIPMLEEFLDSQIRVNEVLIKAIKNPESDLATRQTLFGTKNTPSLMTLQSEILRLQKTKEFIKDPENIDRADRLLQELFSLALESTRPSAGSTQ